MTFKTIQEKLAALKNRIEEEGKISEDSEAELKEIVHQTLLSANDQLEDIHGQLKRIVAKRVSNDNGLNEDQKARLLLSEQLGVDSTTVH